MWFQGDSLVLFGPTVNFYWLFLGTKLIYTDVVTPGVEVLAC